MVSLSLLVQSRQLALAGRILKEANIAAVGEGCRGVPELIPQIDGPVPNTFVDCERILRTVPAWFGIETALMEYAIDSERYPTFVATEKKEVVAFLTAHKHSSQCWEVHCKALLPN